MHLRTLEIYKLDPEKIFSAPGLAWKPAFKKTKVKLDILYDIDIFLMVEKGARGGIWDSIYQFAKTNDKYMADDDKHKESSYLQCEMKIIIWLDNVKKSPVNNFEWIKDTSRFNKDFIKKI